MTDQFSSNDRFGLWRKWFWIGIVVAMLNMAAGLVYGIALLFEKRRKEGLIILVVAIAWFLFAMFFVGPWLVKSGVLPHYKILKVN